MGHSYNMASLSNDRISFNGKQGKYLILNDKFEFSLKHFKYLFTETLYLTWVKNTIVIAISTAVLTLIIVSLRICIFKISV